MPVLRFWRKKILSGCGQIFFDSAKSKQEKDQSFKREILVESPVVKVQVCRRGSKGKTVMTGFRQQQAENITINF